MLGACGKLLAMDLPTNHHGRKKRRRMWLQAKAQAAIDLAQEAQELAAAAVHDAAEAVEEAEAAEADEPVAEPQEDKPTGPSSRRLSSRLSITSSATVLLSPGC